MGSVESAHGTKKPPRLLRYKSKDTQNGSIGTLSSCNSHRNAAVAASVFERKQGYMEWWRKLDDKDRVNVAKCASALLTKAEVLSIVREARARREKVKDSKKTVSTDSGNAKLKTVCRANFSDSEVEQHGRPGTDYAKGAEVAPYFAGLCALREVSESGFPCEISQATESIQEDDTGWLFGSTMESVHTFPDHIRRKVTDAVAKVRNDHIELELLGDGSSGKTHGGTRGENGESKVSKTKKKKRKNTATAKADVPKEVDQTCSYKPELPQEERKELSDPGDAEAQDRSSVVDQAVNEVKPLSGGKQHVSRKGKGGKSKEKKDDKLHQPTLGLKKSAVNDEELARHILDIRSYSDGTLETGNGPCSDCDGPPTSGDSRLDSSMPFEVQVESPPTLPGNCSSEKMPSNCSIVNLGQENNQRKLQNMPIPSLHSTNDKMSISSKENGGARPGSGPPASNDGNCEEVGSSRCTTPAFSLGRGMQNRGCKQPALRDNT